MASKLLTYLDAAITRANQDLPDPFGLGALFNPDAVVAEHPVSTWFGDLDAAQRQTLTGNLTALRDTLLRCDVNVPTARKGSIRLIPGAFNSRYGQAYYAQVRGLGWANQIRPVYSIELGKFHYGAPYGEKVATVFHELTHRVCGTSDVDVGGITQYGTANCQHLASTAPDQALRNADNYGYFIVSCTRSLALEIVPS